jgi:polyisoprenyl-phosphate glycosyltransferase
MSQNISRKKISFVLPVYNEAEGLPEFYSVLCETLKKLEAKYDTEVVFVNDGSTDGSLVELSNIVATDKRVSVVELSRNFGHQLAITAGLDYATGDAVIVMDTDLQDPPNTALASVQEWEAGSEVVYAVRRTRKDSFAKKFTARAFYKILAWFSDYPIPENTGDFRLLDARAAKVMREYRETSRYVRGIAAHIGFKQKAVLFDRDERRIGETHYPLKKMLRLAADAVFSFSNAPLRVVSRIGYVITGLSVIGILYALIVKVFYPATAVPGWTFIIVAVFFLGGLQFMTLGILGEYIGRIYVESKGRPLYIVSRVHSQGIAKASHQSNSHE